MHSGEQKEIQSPAVYTLRDEDGPFEKISRSLMRAIPKICKHTKDYSTSVNFIVSMGLIYKRYSYTHCYYTPRKEDVLGISYCVCSYCGGLQEFGSSFALHTTTNLIICMASRIEDIADTIAIWPEPEVIKVIDASTGMEHLALGHDIRGEFPSITMCGEVVNAPGESSLHVCPLCNSIKHDLFLAQARLINENRTCERI